MKRKVLIMMMGAALMWVLAGCAEYGSAAEPHKDTPSEITVAETVPETVFSVAETPDIAADEGSTYTETSAQYEDPADLSDSTPAQRDTKGQRFCSSFQISPPGPRPYDGGSMMIAS